MTIAFWIADQPGYVNEAIQSAASFKQHNSTGMTALFGNGSTDDFDFVYPLPPRRYKYWYLDSVNYFNHVLHVLHHEKLIYFDVDTCILASLDDLMAVIGRYDLVGAHAPARQTAPTVNFVPDAFPEINVGVLGIANNDVMKRFVGDWFKRYEMYQDIYGNNDQAPLRESLWFTNAVNLYVMPPEYNCRFGFGGFAALPVKVLHGRGMSFAAAERIVNHAPGMRAWTNADLHGLS